ncbi:LysM peptidoglycan-binding domain-containing protein [Actinacidiphila sp. ITFR-21]|uniref:LysM peptidoglycan-binding domain-containing protein n=1 Tax=Actinacidiphila sp. ITFR-21 TaxID=3075199 RepID=UPI00288A0D6C|nr:LysM peptidoglycan-binding domain-containing protein [Streptomyces sp. ITFR-21]WNI20103.1 LysM peptidoglycan-binding domain-containing protein [Streptomyces sp. ITFR-21]
MNTRSKPAAFARGLVSLAALLVLLAAVPYVLFHIGVLPHHMPSGHEIVSALTQQDTGQLFLGAITLIGWYGWLSFAVSVALEAVFIVRQRKAPKLRMLSGTQRLAGTLVGGIILLLPTSGAFASPASAAPHVATASASHVSAAPAAATAASGHTNAAPAAAHTGPVHHVRAGDTLWDIAEQRLGDGLRWREIVEANQGVTQADGSHLTEDATVLQPGWTLRLPSDAQPASSADESGVQTQTGGTAAAHDTEHTVRPGETLSSIAKDELGDAHDYPAIAEANDHVRQPDGRTLTDPDKIYPGWQLKIPTTHGDAGDRTDPPTPPREEPAPNHSSGGEQQGSGQHEQAPAQHGQDKEGDQGGGKPTARPDAPATQMPAPRESAQPSDRTPAAPHTPAEAAPQQDSGSGEQSVKTVAAAGSILAAAVLAVIATRRARQQRRRRAKRRIPMPSGAVADFEKQLRVASDITGTLLADRALRTLAANCRQSGRPLPEVEAMRITARGVELHLAAAVPPVEPFTERENLPTVWWCPARGAALLEADQAADITPPYPALVSLGETADGDPVLVDLETIGLLRLDGSPADVRAVTLALAVELASSKLAPATQVVLAGAGSDLQTLYPDQIDHHTELGEAVAELQAHDAFQRDALTDGGHDHLRGARLSEETSGDSWIPRILVATDAPTGPSTAVLEDLLSSRPRTSVAVVTAAGAQLDLPGAWTFPAQPGTAVELPGLDLAVRLQYLDDAAYDRLVQLLVTSSRTDDVAPPPWTRHTGPADHNGPRHTVVTASEDSALAPETTARPTADTSRPAAGGGDLASALPSFASLAPSYSPALDSTAASLPEQDDSGSALSADALADADTGPAQEDWNDAYADEPDDAEAMVADSALDGDEPEEEGSALDGAVWGKPASADEFDTALSEVLAEQDDVAPQTADDADADEDSTESGLSSAALGQPQGPAAAPAERRIVPRPSAATSTVLAALATPPEPPAAPQIHVLGPVDLVGTLGRVESNRRNALKEIAAWLVLHPGLHRQDLDDAIWPGMRTLADSRNSAISKLRAWVGRDPLLPAGDAQAAYLPPIKGGVYRFSDQVTSDWGQFQDLYQQGMHHDGQDADVALAQALALVRGRPFADVDPAKYTWAEADIQEMISAIVDVAHELAERRRHLRDYRAAAQAVTKGLMVDAQSELLYRDLFTICHEMGDEDGLKRAAHQLARINTEEGCDSSPETVGLLRTLLKGEHAHSTALGSAAS